MFFCKKAVFNQASDYWMFYLSEIDPEINSYFWRNAFWGTSFLLASNIHKFCPEKVKYKQPSLNWYCIDF